MLFKAFLSTKLGVRNPGDLQGTKEEKKAAFQRRKLQDGSSEARLEEIESSTKGDAQHTIENFLNCFLLSSFILDFN